MDTDYYNTVCDQCNEPLHRSPGRLEGHAHHFCNNDCQVAWNKEHDDYKLRHVKKKQNGRNGPILVLKGKVYS